MTSLEEVYRVFLASSGVQTDSRKVSKNQLFFALKGPNFDGNQYAAEALKKGACACVVDDSRLTENGTEYILVDDVLACLQHLANHHRKQVDIPLIALTGSNGKTTTKELILAVLSTTYNVLATEGNQNNHIGVPLTLLRINKSHTHAIIEMGANHIGEIDLLCTIAQPTHGLITNVGRAHLAGFGSEEGVLQGKTELYQYLKKTNGRIFVHEDDSKLMHAISTYSSVYYSATSFELVSEQPTLSLKFKQQTIKTNLVGSYNLANIAAAVAVGTFFDVPLVDIIHAIEGYSPNNSRSQLLVQNGKTLTLDAYNANPTSMRAAVISFSQQKGKKALILGHMAELGAYENQEHQELVDLVNTLDFETCYWIGTPYKSLVKENWFIDVSAFNDYLENNPIEESQVLIKGSRSAALEKVVGKIL